VTTVERRVPFEGIQNFRDLGGYPTVDGRTVRWGEVYRADALHKLTEADLASFRGLGVRTVFDLRGDAERRSSPARSNRSTSRSWAGPRAPSRCRPTLS
jgi:protein-tyrosine phosphatase